MHSRTNISLWIFTLGVLMLLLRPFVVYQIAADAKSDRNGITSISLLQRLIKKKEDHHQYQADAQSVTEERSTVLAPLRRLMTPVMEFLVLIAGLSFLSARAYIRPFPILSYRRYALTSCFLI